MVVLDCWLVGLICGAYPAFCLFKVIKKIRSNRKINMKGLCRKCHYDLRAHKVGDKCPDCGTPKAAADG